MAEVKLQSFSRLKSKDRIVQALGGPQNGENGGRPDRLTGKTLFPRILDVLMFAALLGYQEKRKVPLNGAKETIANDQLTAQNGTDYPIPATDFIFLIALADTNDPNILKEENQNKAVAIVEQYANGGLDIIGNWLNDPNLNQDDLLELIIDQLQERNFWLAL